MKGTILAGALGNDVHVAGVYRFLRLAEELGYETVFLGAAVPVEEFLAAIRAHDPEIVGVSYRLTPEVGRGLVGRLIDGLGADDRKRRRFAFGGTPPVCRTVEPLGFFERCFDGLESPGDVRAFLDGRLTRGDTVLVKASHGSGLWKLADDLVGKTA